MSTTRLAPPLFQRAPIPHRNWAGNVSYGAAYIAYPRNQSEVFTVIEQAQEAGLNLKPLGTGHSFSRVADTDGVHVSLKEMQAITRVNAGQGTVTVEGAVRYGELAVALEKQGYALHNLASLPHISVVGAVATGTHGSGTRNGCLATAVVGLQVVTFTGEVRTLDRTDPDFTRFLFGGGEAGVVTSLTLTVEPTYTVAQTVYEGLTTPTLLDHFDTLMDSAYSVSVFGNWQLQADAPHTPYWSLWRKARTDSPDTFAPAEWGLTPAPEKRHPIAGVSAENCTTQGGLPGPWYDRLPHFQLAFTPSAGEELQAELLLPRRYATAALTALLPHAERIAPHLFISEIRTIAADNLPGSPYYQQDSIGIHFTWKPEPEPVYALLPDLATAVQPFGAVWHRGKISP